MLWASVSSLPTHGVFLGGHRGFTLGLDIQAAESGLLYPLNSTSVPSDIPFRKFWFSFPKPMKFDGQLVPMLTPGGEGHCSLNLFNKDKEI